MKTYLLDTNVILSLLKKQPVAQLDAVLEQNAVILMSPVVYYEVARGLYKNKAEKQLAFFGRFVDASKWCDLNKDTWDLAATLWANCRSKKGATPTGQGIDKDVLIAAQAKQHNAVVATNNVRHFKYLGVKYEIWG